MFVVSVLVSAQNSPIPDTGGIGEQQVPYAGIGLSIEILFV